VQSEQAGVLKIIVQDTSRKCLAYKIEKWKFGIEGIQILVEKA
jgi:hypothetical protein